VRRRESYRKPGACFRCPVPSQSHFQVDTALPRGVAAAQDIERARQAPEVDATQRAQGSARDLAVSDLAKPLNSNMRASAISCAQVFSILKKRGLALWKNCRTSGRGPSASWRAIRSYSLRNEAMAAEFAEQLGSGWWYGTNNSAQETRAWLERACSCAGLTWGVEFKTNAADAHSACPEARDGSGRCHLTTIPYPTSASPR
jgi:hypothetical protein